MLDNGRITLRIEAQGRTQSIARIYVGKIVTGSLNLQTNDSINQFVALALKGLKITESAPSEEVEKAILLLIKKKS